jgi:hypothetical protein
MKSVKKHSGELSRSLIAWYSWAGFYRWVIKTGVTFLGVFAVFSGTILLIDQNEKLQNQNALTKDQFEQKLTYDLITVGALSKFLQDNRNKVLRHIKSKKIKKEKLEFENENLTYPLRVVLNYYEDIALQSNRSRLNINIIDESIGGSMITLFNKVKKYIKNRRCELDEGKRNLKRYEHYEYLVRCALDKKSKYYVGYKSKYQVCIGMIRGEISSPKYCP